MIGTLTLFPLLVLEDAELGAWVCGDRGGICGMGCGYTRIGEERGEACAGWLACYTRIKRGLGIMTLRIWTSVFSLRVEVQGYETVKGGGRGWD